MYIMYIFLKYFRILMVQNLYGKIILKKKIIIYRSERDIFDDLTFIHDCDLTDHKLIEEQLPLANIKFDPNHL